MKQLFIIAFAFISLQSSYSQSFDGVPISGTLQDAVAKFKSKGYTLKETLEGGGVIMNGKINLQPIELWIFTTATSKKVFKMNVFFDKQLTWVSIKSDYNRYLDVLTSKYGEPDSQYDFFTKPYYEGDGYEMSAISLEKCRYAAFWLNRNNLSIQLLISKYKQVEISYQNDELIELARKEQEIINQKSF